MKYIKRILGVVLAIFLCLNVGYLEPKAEDASVTIALSASSVSIGETVTATVTVSGSDVSQYDIYVTYDSSVLQFNSGSGAAQANGSGGTIRLVGGTGSTSLTFSAIANGSSYISTSGTEVYNINYEQLAISHAGANVTVSTPEPTTTEAPATTEAPVENSTTQETTEATTEELLSANCNLVSLQVTPGTLEPEFLYSTTSYQVQLDEDATSIVVSATPEDSKASTSVSGTDNLQRGENTVKVTVTAENGAVKIYTINVIVGELIENAEVTIDGKIYHFVMDYADLEIPEGYTATTIQYESWEITAYEAPNKRLILVCLENEEKEKSWFIFDQEVNEFIPYLEYSANYNRYVILSVPESVYVPEGYYATDLVINDNKVAAYKTDKVDDTNLYLVYAMNIEGSEGFYQYDMLEGTFLRYVPISVAETVTEIETSTDATITDASSEEPKDEGFFTRQVLLYIICALSVLLVIFIIITIVLTVKKKVMKNDLEQAEGIVEHLAAGKEENVAEWFGDSDEQKKHTEKKEAYEEFAKQSDKINSKIEDDYDVSKDSAFADEENADTVPTISVDEKSEE